MPSDTLDVLKDIETKHGINPADLLRRCAESAAQFFKANGYFALPVHILPDAEYIKAVRGTKSFLETSDAGLPAVAGTDAEFETIRKARTVPRQTTKTGTHK